MSHAGFAELDRFKFAVLDGDPKVTFWREATPAARADGMRGEFPHAEMPVQSSTWCMSDLYLMPTDGPQKGESFALGCTRRRGHDGQHVAHDRPGYPVAAWTTSQGHDT